MTTQFITNQDKLLADVVNNILPSTKTFYVLVGYFYFSGFEEIYKNVADKDIKILIGLEIEAAVANKVHEFELMNDAQPSRSKIREDYHHSLVKLFNDTDFFDSKRKREAFSIYLEKIRDGSLEIKKTLNPNHAKLYIFENKPESNQRGEFPGTVITGSSNLSHAGFTGRFEINVISRDASTYSEADLIFKELWNSAVSIVDRDTLNGFLNNVIEKVWLEKLPKPFLMYVRVLEEYFGGVRENEIRLPAEITEGAYMNLKYQVDAIQRAIDTIQRHNGVIIADVVGLGKSIIASAVAFNMGRRAIIIAPPHLKPQWEDYAHAFDFTAKVYSSGKIEQALKENEGKGDLLVIVDEAHKYRNELTEDYASLHRLCQRNRTMLLTATPFNNRPQDVFSMVKLFQIPSRTTLQTVDNLSFQFQRLSKEYNEIKQFQKKRGDAAEVSSRLKCVASEIRDMLEPLVIRRSRLDLEAIEVYRDDLKAQGISFPVVNPPELLEYDLGVLGRLYEKTLVDIAPNDEEEGFIGARYMPASYIKDKEARKRIAEELGTDENLLLNGQVNLAKFMRRLLVRRFESSIHAFRETLNSILNSYQISLNWVEKKGKVPIFKKGTLPDVDALYGEAGEELDEDLREALFEDRLKTYQEKGLILLDQSDLNQKYLEHVHRDMKLLRSIQANWTTKKMGEDPKLKHFSAILKSKLTEDPSRKIVVFSEFADTAQHLYDSLKNELRAFKYSASDASESNKRIIRENFDAGIRNQRNDFDVLIATDAISEGFNLHRAGTIFNYDIPYNPTRVIQRVGRINRINKKMFDELFIFNFFPTATGERETGVRRISTLKMAMVHALFGEDTRVLTEQEEPQSFFAQQFREAMGQQEELSPEAHFEDFIRNLKVKHPEVIQQAIEIPKRTRIQRSVPKGKNGVLVFAKKGAEYAFRLGQAEEACATLGPSDALKLFEAEVVENAQPTSTSFDGIYEKMLPRIFGKRTEVPLDRGRTDAINRVEWLKTQRPKEKEYFDDLLFVLQKLGALPERYAKLIRSIKPEGMTQGIKELMVEVPHAYLLSILERERQIDEGKEHLILSEELI